MKRVTIASQDDIHLLARRLDFHIFRGDKEDRPIKSKLARTLEALGVERGNYKNRENNLIREFRSRISLYEKIAFREDDQIGCCSLMQHYGAPTRLIDFTSSLYVALFFAVEDIEHKKDSVIWCLNEMVIRDHAINRDAVSATDGNEAQQQHEKMRSLANGVLLSRTAGDCSSLLVVHPMMKNERLSRQQGLFIFPRDIDKSVNDILASDFSCPIDEVACNVSAFDKVNAEEFALKIIIPKELRRELLLGLLHKMNLIHEVLFPGIDGFCKSMFYHCSVYS
ncbi:MAG TPA: FRG domain-containing protein [Opitutaceae bacterium]|nr:FRG domain-containing protein [Opitutaceae bacterium]